MNFISLFVIGYIARKLGPSDFGIFNFVTTFTMLFFPFAFMGINRVMIRDLAGFDDKAPYIRKIVLLRFATTIFSISLILLSTWILHYEQRIVYAVFLACFVFLFQMSSEIFTDVFNAYEKMEFTALVKMTAGLTLTVLSVIVLAIGYGLYELISIYALGQFIGLLLAFFLIQRHFVKIDFDLDLSFIKQKMIEGSPFFLMTLMWFSIMRIDTLILSKNVELVELGFYTSSILLITKLSIIPQGLSNAILPTISRLNKQEKQKDIMILSKMFFENISLLALPFVVIISFYSDIVVRIIYGTDYGPAAMILRIGIWAFLFRCIAFVQFSILTALRKQKQLLKSYLIGTCYCIFTSFLLIYYFKSIGAVISFSTTQMLLCILFTYYSEKFISDTVSPKTILKIILLNTILFIFLYSMKPIAYYYTIPLALTIYFGIAFSLGMIDRSFLTTIAKKFK